ncbi:MAG: hypothetical protein ACI91B_001144 [Planctomycetota bacterium]|jgi:hypothetical protein
MFLELRSDCIVETGERLRDRIQERFPDANLGRVASELVGVARKHAERSAAIRKPSISIRLAGILGLLAVAAVIVLAVRAVHPTFQDNWPLREVLAAVEASVATIVFLGAAVIFVWNLDVRRKRARCLHAIHEMRAMAHIVDMHQLTKDPDRIVHPDGETKSSPKRTLSRDELVRYLDYCSEMLSLIGKVAALYVQGFLDPVALQGVDDIENLTTSLSRKIWQKIMILEQAVPVASSSTAK